METSSQKTCTQMLTEALFIKAQSGNNPNVHPSTDEHINKISFIYTVEYHSVIKKMKC